MRLLKELKAYLKNEHLGCYILSQNPLIIASYWHDYLKNEVGLSAKLPSTEAVWLIFQIGYYKSEEAVAEIRDQIAKLQSEHPNYHYIFLNNSKEEDERFRQNGMNSHFINQNIFLDEKRYKIIRSRKKYDAIYLARFTPVKRHYLAKNIKKLLLIGTYSPIEEDYYRESLQILSHAAYKEKVFGPNVTKYMNKAWVGLALSDLEGAMFVSSEYLLSGLPVVSTPSIGGRDYYYRQPYVKIVEPKAEAVAEAVYEFIKHPPDRDYIRNETIKIMQQQRREMIKVIQDIFDQAGVQRDFETEWQHVFVNKLGLRTRVPFSVFRERVLRKDTKLR